MSEVLFGPVVSEYDLDIFELFWDWANEAAEEEEASQQAHESEIKKDYSSYTYIRKRKERARRFGVIR